MLTNTAELHAQFHRGERPELQGADKAFGYTFGCEGLADVEDAMAILAVSRFTLDRRAAEGLLRKGRHPGGGKVVFCRRSIREYLSRLEV